MCERVSSLPDSLLCSFTGGLKVWLSRANGTRQAGCVLGTFRSQRRTQRAVEKPRGMLHHIGVLYLQVIRFTQKTSRPQSQLECTPAFSRTGVLAINSNANTDVKTIPRRLFGLDEFDMDRVSRGDASYLWNFTLVQICCASIFIFFEKYRIWE